MTGRPDNRGTDAVQGGALIKRHPLVTRIWHWANAAVLAVLLMSGLMIFNAHPRLYWGEAGFAPQDAWLILGRAGESAFPGWITLPSYYSLADARLWHFAFAWLLAGTFVFYLGWGLIGGHLRRAVLPHREELRARSLRGDLAAHAALRFPTGMAARHYNPLQKLAYSLVLLVLLPLMILTGLAMAPGMDAAWPWLTVLFGGRQSARSLHFLCAFGLVGFFLIHVLMVILSGPWNGLRAMISGWYRLPREREERA